MKPSGKTRILLIVGTVIISIFFLISGFFAWRSYVIKSQDERSYKNAKDLLEASRPDEAFSLIRGRNRSISDSKSADWLSLEIQALEKLRNIPRLLYLYDRTPGAFSKHEGAALLIARTLLHTGNLEDLAKLQSDWRSRKKRPASWLALAVDALIVEGKLNEAVKVLHSRSFEGPADCARLMRLALLSAKDDLKAAWNYLDRAYFLDPNNPDVRSFRAQILERIGKLPMARVEYVAAHLSDPDNPLLRDQLAEFYRRTGKYGQALETWTRGLENSSVDFIRLKALFWNRVAQPIKFDWAAATPSSGYLQPFLSYLMDLPQGRFWNADVFQDISDARRLLDNRQETFWLRLLQALKEGEESRALEILHSNTFQKKSWNPDIETALKRVLAYRIWGALPRMDEEIPVEDSNTALKHQFFNQLNLLARADAKNSKTGKIPAGLDQLMRSDEAFAAVFMAGGWIEAALQLHRMPVLPGNFPDWVAYGLTQSQRFNRGNKAALEFAGKQKLSPVMELLMAELMVAAGQAKEGLKKLSALADRDSDVGFRSSWLLVLARLDQGDIAAARKVFSRQPRLKNSVAGKEILARIALVEGKTEEARRMYEALEKVSTEAKAYLAKFAYDSQDWQTARRLTEELLLRFPDRMRLRSNLKAIAEAEGKK
jgi:hypothetical protein